MWKSSNVMSTWKNDKWLNKCSLWKQKTIAMNYYPTHISPHSAWKDLSHKISKCFSQWKLLKPILLLAI